MGATGICNDIPILANINLIEYFRISKGNSFKKGEMKLKINVEILPMDTIVHLSICVSNICGVCMCVCVFFRRTGIAHRAKTKAIVLQPISHKFNDDRLIYQGSQ